MAKTPLDLDSVLDRYHRGFKLGRKGSDPQMEEDYTILMEHLDSLNKQKRQAIVQDQINRLISLHWAKIPYSKAKFGEALELELGVPTQQFSEGDLLGLELKTAKAGIKTAIRLGSKIDGSVAHNVCRILQQRTKQ